MIRTVIVEDDLMVAAINREFALKTPEVEIIATLHNGQDALSFLEKTPVDLLLLDVYMSGLTGLEVLDRLRREGNGVEAILITAANDVEQVESALHLGIVDYLVKPFTYERFQEAMQKFLLRRSLRTKETYTQSDIDKLMHADQHAAGKAGAGLEKGMQQQTLDLIMESLVSDAHSSAYLTSEQIATETGLSKVTVRRYINYLIEQKKVASRMNYSTGGRPSLEYAVL